MDVDPVHLYSQLGHACYGGYIIDTSVILAKHQGECWWVLAVDGESKDSLDRSNLQIDTG